LLGQQRFDFAQLGLSPVNEQKVRSLLALPNGIVLITGPTGSGKSTTLYTFLASLNSKDRRIVTIEDPVENKIAGVVQIAVKPEINLTFAAGLRSILRGDPNVVMVGEMRDVETTEIAIRAALTGHLVFSTLHTNDAIGGITRLVDMGIEPFLVGSSVRAFLAQRLVRVLCPWCCEKGSYSDEYIREIGIPPEKAATAHRAVGCDRCRQTGYQGRRAIYEICLVSPQMQEMITRRESNAALKELARSQGMKSLREDGWDKVAEGTTTIEEVVRVTATEAAKINA
jgi:general secretion pathway protein E/type IV pilus assembly protein PilB